MSAWQSGVCSVLAVFAIACDIYMRRIPNAMLLTALASGTLVMVVLGKDATPSPGDALLGLVAGLCCLLPFYALRWMGAGDVKLFSTIGFLLGISALLPIWLASCVTLTLHGICSIIGRQIKSQMLVSLHYLPQTMTWMQRVAARSQAARQGRTGMPYAAHLGACTLAYIGMGGFANAS